MNQELQTALTKFANKDLSLTRKQGYITVVNTKQGNVDIGYKNGQYMISQYNDKYPTSTYAFYVGRKAGAVEWLVNNYQVIHE